MAIEDCIKQALDEGLIDRDTARGLIRKYRRKMMGGMGDAAAQQDLESTFFNADKRQQRQKAMNANAFRKMMADVTAYRDPYKRPDMLEASVNLFENAGFGGMRSVRAMREGLTGLSNARINDFLREFERSSLTGSRASRNRQASLDEIVDAAYEVTVSPRAQGFYESLAKEFEWLRQLRNHYGGTTPARKEWRLPQIHNPDAVNRAFGAKTAEDAKAGWVKFINDRVDFSTMIDDLTGEPFGDIPREEQDEISRSLWPTIGSDGYLKTPEGPTRGSLGAQRTDHRFYNFKDAQAWREYNREFGGGDVFSALMNHRNAMIAEISLMARFGPNPAANLAGLKQAIKMEGDKFLRGETSRLLTGDVSRLNSVNPFGHITHKNLNAALQHHFKTLDAYYDQYRGAQIERPNALALGGTILRNVAGSSLMGSAVIPHLTTNPVIQAFMRKAAGLPARQMVSSILWAFRDSSKGELLRAAMNVEEGINNIAAGAHQQALLQRIANLSHWLPDRTIQWSGLHSVLNAIKGAFYRDAMAKLGDSLGKSWDEIDPEFRARLEGHGVTQTAWRIASLADPYRATPEAAPWLRPQDVQTVGETNPGKVLDVIGREPGSNLPLGEESWRDQQRAKWAAFEAGWSILSYMQGEREVMVPTKSIRGNRILVGDSNPNTLWGQLRLSAIQFKGFIGSFMASYVQIGRRMLARDPQKGSAWLAAMVVSLIVAQLVSIQLKQMSIGRDPLPMDPTTKDGIVTWLRAIASSINFGYVGETIAGHRSSYGHGVAESILGPSFELTAH